MTEHIPQTSASDRYEAARKALQMFDDRTARLSSTIETPFERALAEALRALIAPPGVHESEEDIVQTVIQNAPAHVSGQGIRFQYDDLIAMIQAAIRAGIEYAHERWEPADRPTQEQMLRWLGIEHQTLSYGQIHIDEQYIEKED